MDRFSYPASCKLSSLDRASGNRLTCPRQPSHSPVVLPLRPLNRGRSPTPTGADGRSGSGASREKVLLITWFLRECKDPLGFLPAAHQILLVSFAMPISLFLLILSQKGSRIQEIQTVLSVEKGLATPFKIHHHRA